MTSSTKTTPNQSSNKPFDWIHLELIPLPDQSDYGECVVWWNPETGKILGDQAEWISRLINEQWKQGSVTNSNGTVELSDPFKKPTELASILGLYFWVIPMPVSAPYQKFQASSDKQPNSNNSSLH